MDPILFILQLLAGLAAWYMGKHDGPPLRMYANKGWSGEKDNQVFHGTNNVTKFLFLLLITLVPGPNLQDMAFAGLSSLGMIYLVFDISTGIHGPYKLWHYLGKNDWHGKWWRKRFGESAGKWKAGILAAIIISLNLIKSFVL
jgi:hypothetical protein